MLYLVGILFPHINDDARSKPHQTVGCVYRPLGWDDNIKTDLKEKE